MLAGDSAAGGDLVQEWLEQVEVPPVHERDVDGGPLQGLGGVKPSKPAAQDDDAVQVCHGHFSCSTVSLAGLRPTPRGTHRNHCLAAGSNPAWNSRSVSASPALLLWPPRW